MIPDVKQHIETDTNSSKYIRGILYMLICFGIFGTLLMMMVERKFEMGMLVAIGMKKVKAHDLTAGRISTYGSSRMYIRDHHQYSLVYYFNRHPLRMGGETAKAYERFGFEAIFPTSTEASNFINQGLVVLVIGLLLSLYPMYKVIRLNPVTAMKR